MALSSQPHVATRDTIAIEEPLELRVAGDTFAVTMRTPGHDRELALGLLFAEGLVRGVDDIASVAHCGRVGDEGARNTLEVTPGPGVVIDVDAVGARRGTLITSACGVCGRRSIDALLTARGPLSTGRSQVTATTLARSVAAMRARQGLFDETGGSHGASLYTLVGEHVLTHEDVGRHNAVDKVVGAMLLVKRVPLDAHMLAVSGRAGFEIVQKAHAAGIPVVAAVGAPSSLAVDLARRANVTLAGFVRGEAFTLYSAPERVVSG